MADAARLKETEKRVAAQKKEDERLAAEARAAAAKFKEDANQRFLDQQAKIKAARESIKKEKERKGSASKMPGGLQNMVTGSQTPTVSGKLGCLPALCIYISGSA